MVDYSDTVAKYVESRRSYDLASEAEIYGGGLINLQNKEGKDIYLNTHNIAHSNTNNSKNMVKSNMVAKFKDSSRG